MEQYFLVSTSENIFLWTERYNFSSSDDGYYATDVSPPELKGDWEIQAASISPIHGIQMAVPQKVIRIITFEAKFVGLPKVNLWYR